MKILVTGAAGFIGSHVCRRLCKDGHDVVGVDNLNDYYDTSLKLDRLKLIKSENFNFCKANIENTKDLDRLFKKENFDYVIHLAAQAGVRYSVESPKVYGESNLMGFLSLIDVCRNHRIKHFIYASSSSVYGLNEKIPYSSGDNVDHPMSLYAATKKSNELMAHSYSQMHGLPTTGLRLFSVYGPWCRPDMAFYKFTEAILSQAPIDVYNGGNLYRDFTYIDDVVEAIVRIKDHIPPPNEMWIKEKNGISKSSAPYQIFNVGCGSPIKLTDMIGILEKELGVKALRKLKPMQVGEAHTTYSDTKDLFDVIGAFPKVTIKQGVYEFVYWYRKYYLT